MFKRIRIMKHSKGSYEYNKELRLWELLDEQAEFELVFEKSFQSLKKPLKRNLSRTLFNKRIASPLKKKRKEQKKRGSEDEINRKV